MQAASNDSILSFLTSQGASCSQCSSAWAQVQRCAQTSSGPKQGGGPGSHSLCTLTPLPLKCGSEGQH